MTGDILASLKQNLYYIEKNFSNKRESSLTLKSKVFKTNQNYHLEPIWNKPTVNITEDVDISLTSIFITKNPLCEARKPFHGSHSNLRQIMMRIRITGSQYSIHYNFTIHCQRNMGTYKGSGQYILVSIDLFIEDLNTGREWLIRSHSSARFCFELSGNSN